MAVRIQISLTYNCNLSCKYCIQFMDEILWSSPTEVSLDDLDKAANKLRDAKIEITDIRISGGEPTTHTLFQECVERIKDTWTHTQVHVCTNGIIKICNKVKGVRYRRSTVDMKKTRIYRHVPSMYSPHDLGFIFSRDILPVRCRSYHWCGCLFDIFGFAPCIRAGTLGRILRIDPYNVFPIVGGNTNLDMCKHCSTILDVKDNNKIHRAIRRGKIEYPTKTFREGLRLNKENPFVFKSFQQRLAEEV